ncbi:unnamed protein product [Rangifer tarandus platyrhynchus]|uniref:Uncharacterized protein n=1 Tax=Rangifer tarandus platyrhynchus TaxID=3082113 RepID=A0AC59YCF6_RANTA
MRIYPRVHSGRVQFSQPLEVIMDLVVFTQELHSMLMAASAAPCHPPSNGQREKPGSRDTARLSSGSSPPQAVEVRRKAPWGREGNTATLGLVVSISQL